MEIAGLKKKMKNITMTKIDENREIAYELSRGELRHCRKSWGICIARYGPVDYC